MSVLNITNNDFENEVVKSDLPVLVDFWAEWCGPCKIVSPIVDEIAEELKGELKVVKVNVDDAQDLASNYQVMSIPTLVVFKGGEAVERIVGAMAKDQLLEKVRAKI